MKQVLIKNGQALVEDIPVPQIEQGTLLVKVDYSCISIGTEMSGLKMSGTPLWQRALKQPENVKKAIDMVTSHGIVHTRNVIGGKLLAGNATGYSAAGRVIEVGEGIEDVKLGSNVTCAGAQCAHHAEYICVPRNLAVPFTNELDMASASTVTLGAIAMQGIRRVQPTLGETFVVLGLGILGQLTVQLLRANGCQVIGTDLDKQRIKTALEHGMDYGVHPDETIDAEQVRRLTGGYGADGVIITAATSSDEVVSTAFQMCRKKGRVVLVGDVGLSLKRGDFYQKELDFLISSSYGPGRYDANYEEKGLDYPISYVRWTENRNMVEYIKLLTTGKISVKNLISAIYPIEEATMAYERLKSGEDKPLMVLLSYPQTKKIERVIVNPNAKITGDNSIKVAIVGAGGFAKGMHLPNIQSMSQIYHLQAVMSRTGHNAVATARQFGASYATTDYDEIINDKNIDAVIITTRHNLHAQMALKALEAGKHVLLEKPLALHRQEMLAIKSFYEKTTSKELPVLLTGFNRRFSPFSNRIKQIIQNRSNPMIINYRMNAGYISLDNWIHTEEGGGRNLGEACHIYDLFTFLTGHKAINVQAHNITASTGHYSHRDNFVATMTFMDGSVASLTYTALGAKNYPKEQMEIYVDGKVLYLNDYKSLKIFGSKEKGVETSSIEKGQKTEIEEFARVIMHGGEWPIPLWQQLQTTEISFKVEELLLGGKL